MPLASGTKHLSRPKKKGKGAAAGGEVGLESLHVLLLLGGEEAADLGGAEGGGEAEELVHRDVRSQGPAGCWR